MKKLIAFLICIIMICTLCGLLTACNWFYRNPQYSLSGGWIGYDTEDATVQLYLSASNSKSFVNETTLTVRRTTYNQSEIKETSYGGKLVQYRNGIVHYRDRFFGTQEITLSSDENQFTFKNYKFERTEMSFSEWQKDSFTLIHKDSGDIVYKPLFFEGENRRLLSDEEIIDLVQDIGEGGFVGFSQNDLDYYDLFAYGFNGDMYFLYLTKGDSVDRIFDIQAICISGSFDFNLNENYNLNISNTWDAEGKIYFDYKQDKIFISITEIADAEASEKGAVAYKPLCLKGELVLERYTSFMVFDENTNEEYDFIAVGNYTIQQVKDFIKEYNQNNDAAENE